MLHDMAVLLFAITTGFTASGITTNLYRLLSSGRKEAFGRTVYYASFVLAGPNMLFEKAAKARRDKDCSPLTFWLAAAIAGYWSLALGLLILQIALAL